MILCYCSQLLSICVVFYRKKSSSKNISVSANLAYGEVTLTSMPGGLEGRQYENPDEIPQPGQWTGASTNEPNHSSNPEAPEYASTEDTVGTIH